MLFASIYPAARANSRGDTSSDGRSKSGRRPCRKARNPKKCRRRRRSNTN